MTGCPSQEMFERLLAERLSGAERDGVESHVETCASCQQLLTRLTAADSLARQLCEADLPSDVEPGLLRHLQELVARQPTAADSAAEEDAADQASSDATLSQSAGTPTSAGTRFRILRPHARGGLG